MDVKFHEADKFRKNVSVVDAASEITECNDDLVPEFHDSGQLIHAHHTYVIAKVSSVIKSQAVMLLSHQLQGQGQGHGL